MDNMNRTMKFSVEKEKAIEITKVLNEVYTSLESKGYDPTNQMVGYLLSGDPTYITSHNNARTMIRKIERDEIIEELLNTYLSK